MPHFLDLWRIAPEDLRGILDNARARKAARGALPKGAPDRDAPLAGHTLAMIFEKNSTRTRVSFDMAIRQLGGSSLILTASESQISRGESIEDTARVMSRYVDAVMMRAHHHTDVVAFATAASVPVINGLTDKSHPCQVMADLQTLEEAGLTLKGARLAWVGDGNNMANTFIQAAPKFGFSLAIGAPAGYGPSDEDVTRARADKARIDLFSDPREAVRGADVILADTFVSMGDTDPDKRLADLAGYRVSAELMGCAKPTARFLHCLPAHRGEEVDADVIDGPQSLVFEEAENRLHAQKAVLEWCLAS